MTHRLLIARWPQIDDGTFAAQRRRLLDPDAGRYGVLSERWGSAEGDTTPLLLLAPEAFTPAAVVRQTCRCGGGGEHQTDVAICSGDGFLIGAPIPAADLAERLPAARAEFVALCKRRRIAMGPTDAGSINLMAFVKFCAAREKANGQPVLIAGYVELEPVGPVTRRAPARAPRPPAASARQVVAALLRGGAR